MCFKSPKSTERGATLIEYALLIALVAMLIMQAVRATGEVAADSICRSTGRFVNSPVEIRYSSQHKCCGYSTGGFGGGFTCAN